MSKARNGNGRGNMTVAEAGRKGGKKVAQERGHDFYVKIGKRGGARIKELLAAGRKALAAGK